MPSPRALVLTALVAGLASSGAAARELCVVCEGPDAVYRCEVEDVAPGRQESGAQLLCITTLARDGGHASCSVRRVAAASCEGEPRTIALPAGPPVMAAPASGADERSAPLTGPASDLPPMAEEQAKPGVPDTVEALAKETVESSGAGLKKAGEAVTGSAKAAGEQIGKAGDAVAGAAKKTWGCLTSLFTDCK